jgi:hypothetical protein
MNTPFTRDQFFDVLAAYNTTLWPFVLTLWVVTVVVVIRLFRQRQPSGRLMTGLLAVHWAWAGVAYHAAFFTRINPAAPLFATLFVVQAGLFTWYGPLRDRLHWSSPHRPRSTWQFVALILIVYGLLYPLLARAEGHLFPRLPTFGVPCPTTILTIGLLLAADPPVPRLLSVIPIAWAGFGGQAAFLFGVRTDLMLLASGVAMLVYILGRSSRAKADVATHGMSRDAAHSSTFKSRQNKAEGRSVA